MKMFYGEIEMRRESLKENGIYYPIRLEYYLTKGEYTLKGDNEEYYGIEVVKKSYLKSEEREEKIEISHISDNKEIVCHLLNILKINEVSPAHTRYIVEDLVKERSY